MSLSRYRAWHKPTKSMREVESIDFKNQTVDLEGGEIEQYFDDVILMQATGLQDKNGVDIYEGDIIRVVGAVEDLDYDWGVVKFETGAFVIDYYDLDTEFDSFVTVSLPIEVIGNIYENPNLLEGNQ